jgi:hypothetical protein
MVPQLLPRKIGDVEIFELRGVLANPWIKRIQSEMNRALDEHDCAGLLFNVRDVEKVDDQGAETILKFARERTKSGILGRNLSAYFIAEHMNPQEPIPVFENQQEVVGYFSEEFVSKLNPSPRERRQFARIKTGLPIEFEFMDFGQKFSLEAVVTNLSEGGLYSYFLDANTEELAHRVLDPFDLKMIKIHLQIDKKIQLNMEGKLLRAEKDFSEASGLAVEFYNLAPAESNEIRKFLDGGTTAKFGGRK